MLRRGHKKSRTGCLQCKQRHTKCDEGRPICSLCISSGRECSYLNQVIPQTHLTPANPSPEVSTSPGNTSSQGSTENASVRNQHDQTFEEDINLKHMELLVHLATNKELLILTHGAKNEVSSPELALGLKKGLESPYLMYQLLAFSARHLAFLKPERSASYLHQAVALQTRAVSIFNAAWTEINQSNCVSILLFSSILGHHLLTDTLAKRTPNGIDEFMTNYVQFVEMHRGIHTIAMTAKTQLMQSELEPILSWSASFTSRSPRGNDCRGASELVDQAESLGLEDKKACQLVIRFLQVGFDAVFSREEQGNRYHMLCTWPMLGPPEFTALLVARKPEALVILAYYAALLQHGKHLWQIGDAGVYMLRIISDFLGLEWDYWLEYPRHSIQYTSKPSIDRAVLHYMEC